MSESEYTELENEDDRVPDIPTVSKESEDEDVEQEVQREDEDVEQEVQREDEDVEQEVQREDEEEITEITLENEDDVNELFDGVDDSSQKKDSDTDENDEEADLGPFTGQEDPSLSELEERLNRGAARLSVVGLTENDFEDPDRKPEDLENEMYEVASIIGFGYYGSDVAEEYLLNPADDIDPVWGLLGSSIALAAAAIMLRPDGQEKAQKVKQTVSGIGNKF